MLIYGNSQFIGLKDNSVHCCVTSIPYWNLRCYNLEPVVFGGERNCQHEWNTVVTRRSGGGERDYGSYDGITGRGPAVSLPDFGHCIKCGAWRGELGLEPTPSLFVAHIVQIFREVKRVLHPSGVCWVNVGDTYSTAQNGRSAAATKAAGNDDRTFRDKPFSSAGVEGIKNKDLCGIPWRVAFGLQDDGWYLRSAPPWVKGSPMPESVTDRPGVANEYMFLLTKSERYFFDMDAVRVPASEAGIKRQTYGRNNAWGDIRLADPDDKRGNGKRYESDAVDLAAGRNLRTSDFFRSSLDAYIEHLQYVRDNGGMMLDKQGLPMAFLVNSKGYPGAHYATFPVKLVEPCILAGTSARGVCPKCGAPWKRDTESSGGSIGKSWYDHDNDEIKGQRATDKRAKGGNGYKRETTGWSPTCHCNAGDPVPAVILDPFAGSGTVGEAARIHGRRFVGIDLNPSYLQINALPRAEKLTSEKAIMELPLFSLRESTNGH